MTMAMLMLMTMRSSVALRLMEEYLRFFSKRAGKGSVFFCSKQQAKRRKIVTQISSLNEISFPRKALFRLFVSSADREPPDGIKKLQKGWISH